MEKISKKMKTALKVLGLIFTGMVLVTELNYEMAAEQAAKVDSDAEIITVMRHYGFELDSTFEVNPADKFEAVFRLLSDENR
jgi:hypothetical protein